MERALNIAIAGTGNAANTLIKKSMSGAFTVSHIWGRNDSKITEVTGETKIKTIEDPESFNNSDILILAVSDNAIEGVSNLFQSFTGLVIHLSGTTELNVIKQSRKAVVWPVQSMKGSLSDVPCVYECADADLPMTLLFIKAIGGIAQPGNHETRKKYHMAAVFFNNFTNFVVASGQKLLDDPKEINLFLPMMRQSLQDLEKFPARELQTGPARRGDEKTIDEHLKLLKNYPMEKELYIELTRLIRSYYKNGV